MGNNSSKSPVNPEEIQNVKRSRFGLDLLSPKHGMNISSPTIDTSTKTKSQGAELPLPAAEDLEKMFQKIVDDLNLSDGNKEKIQALSMNRKWLIVQAHLNGNSTKDVNNDETEVDYFHGALQNSQASDSVLKALVVCLRSKPIKWVNRFLEKDGLQQIITLLEQSQILPTIPSHSELKSKQ